MQEQKRQEFIAYQQFKERQYQAKVQYQQQTDYHQIYNQANQDMLYYNQVATTKTTKTTKTVAEPFDKKTEKGAIKNKKNGSKKTAPKKKSKNVENASKTETHTKVANLCQEKPIYSSETDKSTKLDSNIEDDSQDDSMTPRKNSTTARPNSTFNNKFQKSKKNSYLLDQSNSAQLDNKTNTVEDKNLRHSSSSVSSTNGNTKSEKTIVDQQLVQDKLAINLVIPEIGIIVFGDEIKKPEFEGHNHFFAQSKGISPIEARELPIPFGGLV